MKSEATRHSGRVASLPNECPRLLLVSQLEFSVGQSHCQNAPLVNCQRHWLLPLKVRQLRRRHARGGKRCVGIAQQRVPPRNSSYIFLRFSIRRYPPTIFLHGSLTGIVSGEREVHISVKTIEQKTNITSATFNVLSGIEDISNPETHGGTRH